MAHGEILMTREEIREKTICLTKGKFGKPDLSQVEVAGRSLMVKDVREKHFFLRWTLGLWLIHKEWKIYSRLAGIKGVPQPVERIDRFAFAMEFVPGKPIQREEPISSSFFSDLEQVLREIHTRGVVHLDLRHRGNILLSEGGEPFLIDFNSSFAFKEKGFLRHYLFPLLRRVDEGGLLKLKKRIAPALLTPKETAFLKRFERLRKLWIFN
ncbi:MAG TPA: RIO1 family regulatory kinase/ATPase [Thermodesulfobacteriota bacterium]|jgi:serine/threonine protein kinase|nr:RIO1 family regulatory kinase/ATPase [Thermodesulfobacteriota bacterium]